MDTQNHPSRQFNGQFAFPTFVLPTRVDIEHLESGFGLSQRYNVTGIPDSSLLPLTSLVLVLFLDITASNLTTFSVYHNLHPKRLPNSLIDALQLPNPADFTWISLVDPTLHGFLIYDTYEISHLLLIGEYTQNDICRNFTRLFKKEPTRYAQFWIGKNGKANIVPQRQRERLELHLEQSKMQVEEISKEYASLTRLSRSAGSAIINNFASHPECLIYELLQNATDAGATEVNYSLDRGKETSTLIVRHNGAIFCLANVHGLTNFASSNKFSDRSQIGNKGIGFKSIFAVAQSVTLTSGPFALKYTRRLTGRNTWIEFQVMNTPKNPRNPETCLEVELESKYSDTIMARIHDMTSSKALLILASLDKKIRTISTILPNPWVSTEATVKDPQWKKMEDFEYHLAQWQDAQHLIVRRGTSAVDYVCVCLPISHIPQGRLPNGRIYKFLPLVDEKNAHILDIHGPFNVTSRRDLLERDASTSAIWKEVAAANANLMTALHTEFAQTQGSVLKRLYWRLIPPPSSPFRTAFCDLFARNCLAWTLPKNNLCYVENQALLKEGEEPGTDGTPYLDVSDLSPDEFMRISALLPRYTSSLDYGLFWGKVGSQLNPIELVESNPTVAQMIELRGHPDVYHLHSATLVDHRLSEQALERLKVLCGPPTAPFAEATSEAHEALSALLRIVLTFPDQFQTFKILKTSSSRTPTPILSSVPCSFIEQLRMRSWVSILQPGSFARPRFVLYAPYLVTIGAVSDLETHYFPSRVEDHSSYLLEDNLLGFLDPKSPEGLLNRLQLLRRHFLSFPPDSKPHAPGEYNLFATVSSNIFSLLDNYANDELEQTRELLAKEPLIYHPTSNSWLTIGDAYLGTSSDPKGLFVAYPRNDSFLRRINVSVEPTTLHLLSHVPSMRAAKFVDLHKDNRLIALYMSFGNYLPNSAPLDSTLASFRPEVADFLQNPVLLNVDGSVIDLSTKAYGFAHLDAFKTLFVGQKPPLHQLVHPALVSNMSEYTRCSLSQWCPNVVSADFPKVNLLPSNLDQASPNAIETISILTSGLSDINAALAEAYIANYSAYTAQIECSFAISKDRHICLKWCDQEARLTGIYHEKVFYVFSKKSTSIWHGLWTWKFASEQTPFPHFSTDFPKADVLILARMLGEYFDHLTNHASTPQQRINALESCSEYFRANISVNSSTTTPPPSSPLSVTLNPVYTPGSPLYDPPRPEVVSQIGDHPSGPPALPRPTPPHATPAQTLTPPLAAATPEKAPVDRRDAKDSASPSEPHAKPSPSPSVKPQENTPGKSPWSPGGHHAGTPISPEVAQSNQLQGKAAEEVALMYELHRLRNHKHFLELPFFETNSSNELDYHEVLAGHVVLTRKSAESGCKDKSLHFGDAYPWDIHSFEYIGTKWFRSRLEIKCTKSASESFHLSKREFQQMTDEHTSTCPYVVYFYQLFNELEVSASSDASIVPPTATLKITDPGQVAEYLKLKEEPSYTATFKDFSKHLLSPQEGLP